MSSVSGTKSYQKRADGNSLPPLNGKASPKAKRVDCTFHQFFGVWCVQPFNNWQVPEFHHQLLDFLSDYKSWENNTGLVQIFRGAGKSTMLGLWITWMLTQDPTLRFLIISADHSLAQKITTDIQSIIRSHPLAKHLHGAEGTWRTDSLVVAGSTDGRNLSVSSRSIESNITGARADVIVYDDVEVRENSATDYKRDQLRIKLDEPTHILVPGGYELFVGTPHSFDSIYTELEGTSGKEDPFRTGCSSLKIPVMTEVQGEFPNFTGTPTWPERFTAADIKKRQDGSKTKGHFLSQYLLQPYNPSETVLDPTLISTYSFELEVHTANGSTLARLKDYRVMGVSAYWDPSSATLQTDDSVLAIVFTTEDGNYFIHRAIKLDGGAEEQCHQVIQTMLDNHVSHVFIETNGIGNFLPAIFKKIAEGKGVTCEGKHTSQNKLEKIMHAYETRLSAGFLHAHKSVMETPFRTQLRDFNHRSVGRGKDDFIDAVAMAILAQPIRIKAGHYGVRSSTWQAAAGGGSIECESDGVCF